MRKRLCFVSFLYVSCTGAVLGQTFMIGDCICPIWNKASLEAVAYFAFGSGFISFECLLSQQLSNMGQLYTQFELSLD